MECAICYEDMDMENEVLEAVKNDKTCIVINSKDNTQPPCIKLVCGHIFHYNCLQTSLRKIVQRNSSFKKRWGECPYCRSFNGYIPLLPKNIPIKGVHKEYKSFEKNVISGNYDEIKKYLNPDTCGAILKSGNFKGSQCQKAKNKSGFCSRHERYYGEKYGNSID
jgi:hypothetical protein